MKRRNELLLYFKCNFFYRDSDKDNDKITKENLLFHWSSWKAYFLNSPVSGSSHPPTSPPPQKKNPPKLGAVNRGEEMCELDVLAWGSLFALISPCHVIFVDFHVTSREDMFIHFFNSNVFCSNLSSLSLALFLSHTSVTMYMSPRV